MRAYLLAACSLLLWMGDAPAQLFDCEPAADTEAPPPYCRWQCKCDIGPKGNRRQACHTVCNYPEPTKPAQPLPDCRSKPNLDCAVYTNCFARHCNCEGTDYEYFFTYGKKYCERFSRLDSLSPSGVKWRNATLYCLREAIVPKLDLSGAGRCDCKSMRTYIFDSHVTCYTLPEASICDLPPSDIAAILGIVDLRDQIDRDSARQILGVARRCLANSSPGSPEKQAYWKAVTQAFRERRY